MEDSKNLRVLQLCLMCIYKLAFELFFMPTYIHIFSYKDNWRYEFDFDKWFLSNILFVIFLIFQAKAFSLTKKIYEIVILFANCICIIPLLSTYAYNNSVAFSHVIYPALFWLIFIGCCYRYAIKEEQHTTFLYIPFKANHINIILFLGIFISVVIWLWAGHPIITSLDDTTAQRMLLRTAAMPSVLSYPFMILGGTLLPFMFAYCIDKKMYLYAALFFVSGMLLFFTNGMKTWLFTYLFIVGIYFVNRISRESTRVLSLFIVSVFILLVALCCLAYTYQGRVDFVSQLARVTLLPNYIGFKSIAFFSLPEHELLYLRESILRTFFETPYVGGSDFYINYGASSTLESSRANNGLWGDAFRNFGIVGMLIYPILIAKIFKLFEVNSNHLSLRLRMVIMFIVLWHSVNVSFFAWLLTGGIIILWLILKIDKDHAAKEHIY